MKVKQATNGRFCSVKTTVTATCNSSTMPSAADLNKNITPNNAKTETKMSKTTKTTRTANGVNIAEKTQCLGHKRLEHASLHNDDIGKNSIEYTKRVHKKKSISPNAKHTSMKI